MSRSYAIEGCIEKPMYRYRLDVRTEVVGTKQIAVIQLNPSVATYNRSDPTVGKVSRWAACEAFTVVSFLNLFAYRTPYREELANLPYSVIVGPDNDQITSESIRMADTIILAWGRPIDSIRDSFDRRVSELARLLDGRATACVGALSNGTFPRHGRMWNSPNRGLRPYLLS